MLQRLLQRISQGGVVSLSELARELGVSQDLLETMIADLARLGYLRPAGDCVQPSCHGCRIQACPPGRPRFWMPTDRATSASGRALASAKRYRDEKPDR